MMRPVDEFSRILGAVNRGEAEAAEQLLPLVYTELRQLAAARMRRERSGQTLQPTALVHEAYLRLVRDAGAGSAGSRGGWDSRGHFFAAAAEAMRRILIERARRRHAVKHGGGRRRVELSDLTVADERRREELLALDEALGELEQHDAQAARLVKLRYFACFGHQEAAEAMGITRRAADRLWALARAWLHQRISG
jgi:RNA polymerase sigma factor (TIGR02999 family)